MRAPANQPDRSCHLPRDPNRRGSPEAGLYDHNFCGGSEITSPEPDVCELLDCIDGFWDGEGYIVVGRGRWGYKPVWAASRPELTAAMNA